MLVREHRPACGGGRSHHIFHTPADAAVSLCPHKNDLDRFDMPLSMFLPPLLLPCNIYIEVPAHLLHNDEAAASIPSRIAALNAALLAAYARIGALMSMSVLTA